MPCGGRPKQQECMCRSDSLSWQYRETNQDVSAVFDQVLRLDGTKKPEDLMSEIKAFLKPDS